MKEFEGILSNNPQVKNLDAVVGFLRASGYFSLRPFLDGINKVRILIGIDVDKYIARAHQKGELFFGAEEEVKEECLRLLKEDIEQSHYTKKVEDGMLQMVQDLIEGKLELRAHPSKKIHAKIYILYPDNYNQHCFGAAITGCSNLSGNGLGITEERQYEFNVKLTQFDDVQFAKNEFELLWGTTSLFIMARWRTKQDVLQAPSCRSLCQGYGFGVDWRCILLSQWPRTWRDLRGRRCQSSAPSRSYFP